ncbi:MAG TPA: putative quinol monooxygenase [Pseudonocardia sp.]
MSTPTDRNPDLVTVIASMRARAGMEEQLRAALEAAITPTKAEEGNVNYDLHQAVDDPAVFYFYENWVSAEALDQHMRSAHLRELAAHAGELVDGAMTVVQLRRIA